MGPPGVSGGSASGDRVDGPPRVTERRPLGRTGRTVPVVGADLTVLGGAGPDRFRSGAGGPRGSWAQGVELFDVAMAQPEPTEVTLGQTRPSSSRAVSVFVALAGGVSATPKESAGVAARIVEALEASRSRIGRPVDVFPVILPNQLRWLERPQTVDTLESLAAAGTIGGWGLRITPQTRLDRMGPVLEAGADFLLLPGNLLDHRLARDAARAVEGAGVSLVLTDPHAGGALDGGFLRGSAPGARASASFEPWDALERRLRPVTRLGFLTGRTTRSLSEAAVQFDLQLPAVASVLVDPSEPSVVVSAFAALGRPPIPPADLVRLEEELGAGGPSPGVGDGPNRD